MWLVLVGYFHFFSLLRNLCSKEEANSETLRSCAVQDTKWLIASAKKKKKFSWIRPNLNLNNKPNKNNNQISRTAFKQFILTSDWHVNGVSRTGGLTSSNAAPSPQRGRNEPNHLTEGTGGRNSPSRWLFVRAGPCGRGSRHIVWKLRIMPYPAREANI